MLGGNDRLCFEMWTVNKCFKVGSNSGVCEHPTGTVVIW